MRADAPLSSRHPFEIFTLVLCILVGVPLIFGDATPGSVADVLPTWAENFWGVGLGLGATVGLAGVAWPERYTGILIEQVGLVILGVAILLYAAMGLISLGSNFLVPGAIVTAFGGSCLWRWVQLQGIVKDAQRIVEATNGDDNPRE